MYSDGEIQIGAGSGRFLSGRDDYSLADLTSIRTITAPG
jgi:hypothetical protein